MDLSCIILTWNSQNNIGRCLSSLLTELHEANLCFEIFVVDNGSTDLTQQIIEQFRSRHPTSIIPILLSTNTGTTYPRNVAIKRSLGRVIAFMDSDIEIVPKTIPHLMSILGKDRQVGLVAPKLIHPDGKFQKSTDRFPTLTSKLFRYIFLRQIEKSEAKQYSDVDLIEVDYAVSAMWLFKREIIDKVGFLDEKIFYAPEDVDYCLRIWSSGYKIIFDLGSVAIHHAHEISRGWKINRHTVEHIKGLAYYFKKHGYLFRAPTTIRTR